LRAKDFHLGSEGSETLLFSLGERLHIFANDGDGMKVYRKTDYQSSSTTSEMSCVFNDGYNLESGSSVTAYSLSTSPWPDSCDQYSATVTCENGILSPSGYGYQTCSNGVPAD